VIRAAVVAAVLVTLACGRDRPVPAPPPGAAPAESAPLRPLTSRDSPTSGATEAGSLPPGHPPITAGTAAEGPAIEGEIRLDPRIRDKARLEDVLYVIARNSATRQVVAVRKEERARFPLAFRLSASDAMMEGVPFTGPFDLTARLSRSGDAVPQAGDLEGTVKNVDAGSRGVRVVVDTVRP
jgi:cytochrome c-type biogenesis protein CcmH